MSDHPVPVQIGDQALVDESMLRSGLNPRDWRRCLVWASRMSFAPSAVSLRVEQPTG
jgi:hypothetical protein